MQGLCSKRTLPHLILPLLFHLTCLLSHFPVLLDDVTSQPAGAPLQLLLYFCIVSWQGSCLCTLAAVAIQEKGTPRSMQSGMEVCVGGHAPLPHKVPQACNQGYGSVSVNVVSVKHIYQYINRWPTLPTSPASPHQPSFIPASSDEGLSFSCCMRAPRCGMHLTHHGS